MTTLRPSRDVFHRLPEATFRTLVAESTSVRQVFLKMGICVAGDQYTPFRRRVAELDVDLSHFRGTYPREGRFKAETPLERVFTVDTHYNGTALSRKIRKHGLKPYCCVQCGNLGEWDGKPLALQMDHVNGVNTDNRLDNLRYLCPNCHSQTETFAGRRHRVPHHCVDCGKPCSREGSRCRACGSGVNRPTQVDWPSVETITLAVWERPASTLAREWGCSLAGLKKHCRKHGIVLPPMGYWRRRETGRTHQEALTSVRRQRPTARRMSPDQIEKAKQMVAAGASHREVGVSLGFAHTTVGRTLGRLER